MGYSPWHHKESDTTEHTHSVPRIYTQLLNNNLIKNQEQDLN